jgi:hypothetical protein
LEKKGYKMPFGFGKKVGSGQGGKGSGRGRGFRFGRERVSLEADAQKNQVYLPKMRVVYPSSTEDSVF